MNPEEVKVRVLKLLSLARNNPEPNEAALAFARAQDIATRHGLELDEIEGSAEDGASVPEREVEKIAAEAIDVCEGKSVYWRVTIACAVARANGCRPYVYRGTMAVGQPSDLATARYISTAIIREVDAMAADAVRIYKSRELDPRFDASPRKYGAAWRTGCADAIANRLRSQAQAIEAERKAIDERRMLALAAATAAEQIAGLAIATTALVRVERAAEYMTRRDAAIEQHPTYKLVFLRGNGKVFKDGKTRERGGGWGASGGRSSREGYSAGRSAGNSMNIGGDSRRAIGGGK